jgi:hypothetical protein
MLHLRALTNKLLREGTGDKGCLSISAQLNVEKVWG